MLAAERTKLKSNKDIEARYRSSNTCPKTWARREIKEEEIMAEIFWELNKGLNS